MQPAIRPDALRKVSVPAFVRAGALREHGSQSSRGTRSLTAPHVYLGDLLVGRFQDFTVDIASRLAVRRYS